MKRTQSGSPCSWLPFTGIPAIFSLVRPVILGVMVATVASPVLAQPVGASLKPASDFDKRVAFVDKQLAPKIAQDFDGSLSSVHDFLEANPRLDPWERVQVYVTSASRLYSDTPAVKRAGVANAVLGLLDEGWQEAKAVKFADPFNAPRAILDVANAKMVILLAEKRTDQAGQVLDQAWPTVISTWDHMPTWYKHWRTVRTMQGQPQKAVDGLVNTFEQRVLLHDRAPTPVSIAITEELLAQGKEAEALSWAKLTFMISDFDEASIRDATQLVNRCLSMGQMTVAKANVFAQAQTDPDAVNPLDQVALPQLDTKSIRARLSDPKANLSLPVRTTCQLLLGDYRSAMLAAKNQLMTDVGNQGVALQVARVFKAKDGDIARANQFLSFYQGGEGDNPVPAFLKETESAAAPVMPR